MKRLDEYFVAMEEIPQWRRDMKIGRPISDGAEWNAASRGIGLASHSRKGHAKVI